LFLGLRPARDAGAQRNEGNVRMGKFCVDLFHKRLEVLKYLLDTLARPKVISAGAQKNHARLVRKDDAFGKMGRIHDLRAAEAAIKDLMMRKILRQRAPAADRRGTDE